MNQPSFRPSTHFTAMLCALAACACSRAERQPAGVTPGEQRGSVITTGADAGLMLTATTRATTTPFEPASDRTVETHDDSARVCGAGMVLVTGDYCPEVEHRCLEWLDPPGSRYERFRCARYAKPAVCRSSQRRAMRFCIARTEHLESTEREGATRELSSALPVNKTSWTDASRICRQAGARLCTASEWQFACEGEEMRPYPYGWERDPSACNVEIGSGLGKVGRLVDHRAPPSAFPRCLSAFGVHGMAGNVDEWVTVEGLPPGRREVMKGSWWIPGRHACRSFQAGHGASYGGTETGVRCCKDTM